MGMSAEPNEPTPWHHAWGQVDQTSDPRWFIEYLDAVRGDKLKLAASEPERFLGYLDVHEGQHVLEVGCGTGDLLPLLARLVGHHGRVVGVDKSATMIAEAARRSAEADMSVECCVGDAYQLGYNANTFERCFTSAMFQHLGEPAKALAEMVRVVRPGGRIAVTEHDWETQIIAADDHVITRKLLNFFCDEIRSGWAGRQLQGLFQEHGLRDVVVAPITFASTDYQRTSQSLRLPTLVARSVGAGAITQAEGEAWLADLERRGRAGTFFRSVTAFRVIGHKPYPSFC